ncbi:lipoprotein signal peptidase [Candidatus Phycosocius bacilliformis]|uniref:Lipoprotein signal peptidase n=1 Tax=Candidatus Phycosocius bacilliformis TaxID=1445552 RepID=A0A2P2EAP4_9PROT|nr:signal peptidase II [Candidatus Phycosocius bacilliformis]GBF58113.1 lipoprotein signal peptidase [Candidatus Phycosocius bacilliformis]
MTSPKAKRPPAPSPAPIWGVGLILLILGLDQISKYWVLNHLDLLILGHIEISPIFDLTMVWNYGVSFGALKAHADWQRWALVALSAGIASIFAIWLFKAQRRQTFLALSLVIGGAIGNMIDRVRFGAVADFLNFSGLYFPWVFNVADAAITVGAILLALDMLMNPDDPPQSKQDSPSDKSSETSAA